MNLLNLDKIKFNVVDAAFCMSHHKSILFLHHYLWCLIYQKKISFKFREMSGIFLINADNYELSSFHSTSNTSQQIDVIFSKEDFTTWESIPYQKIKLSINNDQYSLQLVYYFLYDTHVSEDFDILVLKISWFVIRQSSRNGPCSEIIFMNNLTNYTQSFQERFFLETRGIVCKAENYFTTTDRCRYCILFNN